jgi:hypothetical protein
VKLHPCSIHVHACCCSGNRAWGGVLLRSSSSSWLLELLSLCLRHWGGGWPCEEAELKDNIWYLQLLGSVLTDCLKNSKFFLTAW